MNVKLLNYYYYYCSMLLRVVGSCCTKFETRQTFSYVQNDATIPNIVGPSLFGVVASVCT